MDTSYNKDKDEDEGMTPDSEPSTPDPLNNGQVIDRNNKTDTTEKFWKSTTKPRSTTIIPTST